MAGVLLGNALAWRHVKSAYRRDCLAALLDTLLRVLDGLDTPARQRDHSVPLRWVVELEDAASLLTKSLVPPAYLRYLSSADWLTRRFAGWAEGLFPGQRGILAPNSGARDNVQVSRRHEIKCEATAELRAA